MRMRSRTLDEKYNAIIKLIESCREKKQPCLVELYQLKNQNLRLLKGKIHEVLNAKNHLKEAEIVANATGL